MQIIPAPLTDNPQELKEFINLAEEVVDRFHVDIIDGKFAQNKTVLPEALKYIETNLKLDFHLMVDEPANWVESCAHVGADRIYGHIEKMKSQDEFVKNVIDTGTSVGLAVDLPTDISKINHRLLSDVDAILVMSVKAGFDGQAFEPAALNKIRSLAKLKQDDDSPFTICVDGGITLSSIREVKAAGADQVSIGRRLFAGNLAANIKQYKSKANGG